MLLREASAGGFREVCDAILLLRVDHMCIGGSV